MGCQCRSRIVTEPDASSSLPRLTRCQSSFCIAMPHFERAIACHGQPPSGCTTGFTRQTKFDQMVFDFVNVTAACNKVVLNFLEWHHLDASRIEPHAQARCVAYMAVAHPVRFATIGSVLQAL